MADGKPGRPLPALTRDINDLCECVREKWAKLVDILEEEEKPIFLATISVLRTEAQQAHLVEQGFSWTMRSKHLPQPPKKKSLAIDVAPVKLLPTKGWSPRAPEWQVLGRAAQALGLKWGVWKKDARGVLQNIDLGHLYLDKCECPPVTSERADAVVASLQEEDEA